MAFNLGDIIVHLKADSRELESGVARAESRVGTFARSVNSTNFGAFARNASNTFGSIADGIASVTKKLAIVAVASSYGGSKFVSLAGDLQTAQLRMTALSGSADDAKRILGELYTYSLGKPIAFPDVAKASQVLMGYGVTTKNVVSAMKTLSAFSIVNGADMGQLALAYGQVNAKGRLMGQEIIQLTNNFVPVSQVIAKHFNVSVKEAQDLMEGGKVSAQEFNAAMAEFIPEDAIAKQANSFKNRMISLQGSIRSFGLALIGVKVDPKLGLVVEQGGLFDRLSNFLPKMADGLKKLKPAMVGAFQWIIDNGNTVKAIVLAIGAAFVVAKAGAIAFGIIAAANPVGLIIAGITALVAALTYLQVKYDIIGKTIAFVKPYFDSMVTLFQQYFLPSILALANSIVTYLWPALKQLWDSVVRLWNALNPALMTAIKVVAAILAGLFMAQIWLTINVINILVKVFSFTASAISNVIKWVSNLISWFGNLIGATRNAVGWVANLIGSLPGRVTGAVNSINAQFRRIPDFIRNLFKDAYHFLFDVGKWIVWGLKDGMLSVINSIKEAGGKIADSVKDKVKNLLGIHSPSLVFADIGRNVIKGFVKGIEQNKKIAISAMSDLSSGLMTPVFGTNSNASIQSFLNNGASSLVPASPLTTIGGARSNSTNIFGDINIGSKSDADYLLKKIDRDSQLEGMGVSVQ